MTSQIIAILCLGAAACAAPPHPSSTPAHPAAASSPSPTPSFAGCRADRIEDDLKLTPTAVNATADPHESLWISTTYLALTTEPSGQAAFRQSMTTLLRVLPKTPGLVAFRFATSESCVSARTLAVWRTAKAMSDFVNSPEHHAAMRQISVLSRGTSTFTHWQGDMATAEWARAAQELATDAGAQL